MVNLLDGIKKLKERRLEATMAVGTVSAVPDEFSNFIMAYEAIGEKSVFVRGENSTANDQDKQELERLEKSFSFRWDNLPEDKQKELVDRILEAGLLPEKVRQVREMFNGKVVSLL